MSSTYQTWDWNLGCIETAFDEAVDDPALLANRRGAEAEVAALAGTPCRDLATLMADMRAEQILIDLPTWEATALALLRHPDEIRLFVNHYAAVYPRLAARHVIAALVRGRVADGTAPVWWQAVGHHREISGAGPRAYA